MASGCIGCKGKQPKKNSSFDARGNQTTSHPLQKYAFLTPAQLAILRAWEAQQKQGK